MSLHAQTFTITLPHPETETYEEEFECTFEVYGGEPMTYDHPGSPAECNLISAYASISGPVDRAMEIPEDEVERIEIAMMEALEDGFDDCDPPEYEYED